MARSYEQLKCGCLVSCDGGGGLISNCSDNDSNCKVKEYMKKHNIRCGGYCKICNPFEFNRAKKKGEKIYE